MKTLLALTIALLFAGCAGTGPNGAYTPQDAEATARALSSIYGTGSTMYHDYRNGGYGTQP